MVKSFVETSFTSRTEYDAWLVSLATPAVVFDELRKATAAAGGQVPDGPAIVAAVRERVGDTGVETILGTFPFQAAVIKSASMLFTVVDSPLDPSTPDQ